MKAGDLYEISALRRAVKGKTGLNSTEDSGELAEELNLRRRPEED